jgi:serpin B
MKTAIATVNKWCSDNTNGLIKDFYKEEDKLSDVEILNALYFKGLWARGYKFDSSGTFKNEFTKSNGQKVMVDMMHNQLNTKYYMDNYLILASLTFGNKAYNMYFVLPNSGKTLDEMVKQMLLAGYWSDCINRSKQLKVDMYIPRFEVKYENDKLKDILVQMGMGIVCSPAAEFTLIAENTNFYVRASRTKTYIKVDEKGTEAAAATSIKTPQTSNLPEPSNEKPVFPADRPFLFVIQENSTGTILFMGKIGDPTEK